MLLGGFDGLHLGHRQLLSYAKKGGLSVGVMTIVGGKDEGLFTFAERERIFAQNGVDFVFELPFSEIKDLSPQQFIELLISSFQPKLLVCGEDFRFGKSASGTPEILKASTHVRVEVLPLVKIEEEKISTRFIKKQIEKGEVAQANTLLGQPFFLLGEVVRDRQIGRKIGFPTANVAYPTAKYPLKKGVYETLTWVDGVAYKGITNYGARPTFDNEQVLTETYLDGFDGDLYGKEICVEFIRYLREIKKFDSVEGLRNQLSYDLSQLRGK